MNLISTTGTVLVAGSPAGNRYTFDGSTDICSPPLGYTGVVCVVNKQITLRGGFSTVDWSTSLPDVNTTIIDGQQQHRGLLVTGMGPRTSLDVSGFTIENGLATGTPARPGLDAFYAFGAGLLADVVDDLRITDMSFKHNVSRGDDVATEFGGAGSGGGAALRGVALATIQNVRFERNQAHGGAGAVRGGYAQGGGLYTFRTTLNGRGIVLRDNQVTAGTTAGSGLSPDGERADALGGGADFQQESVVTLSELSAVGNSAVGGGAQTYAGGAFGGAVKAEEASVVLSKIDLRENRAVGGNAVNGYIANGGAIEAIHSDLQLEAATVVDNLARGGDGTSGWQGPAGGGGIAVEWVTPGKTASLEMTNCIVADNDVEQGAGTIVTGGGGGGMWIQALPATLRHVTVANNGVAPSMQGQAILLIEAPVAGQAPQGASATLSDSVIADHTGYAANAMAAVHVKPSNSLSIANVLFANDSRDTNAGGVPAPSGAVQGLASAVDANSAGFVAPGPPWFNYHLAQDSPARNLATDSTVATDIDLETRTAPRDLGADEYMPGGSLAGHVDDGAGQGAGDVAVDVFDGATLAPSGTTQTDGAGDYVIGGLPSGKYVVRFSDAERIKRFLIQWYDGAGSDFDATRATVSSGMVTAGIDASLEAAPLCHGLPPTIVGSNGDDFIVGTSGPDVIVTADGDDEVRGGGGNDTICTGKGDDVVSGGSGGDYLNGGPGNDALNGDGGNDTLKDGPGNDSLMGGPGDDHLKDRRGSNVLSGGQGSDSCTAKAARSTMTGCESP